MASRPTTESPTPEGLLLVDKPAGVTSHDVVARARRVLGVRRIGHAGTLDPFATGLLVLLVGRATRLLPYMDGEPKEYDAEIALGVATDTDDGTGTEIARAALPAAAAVHAAIDRLTGALDQIPPAYSAKQVGGVRAYDAARRGAPIVLAPARVVVHAWREVSIDSGIVRARIVCGGGTYIRSLARDLGTMSGAAAHLRALRRVRSGAFDVDDAIGWDALADRSAIAVRPSAAALGTMAVQRLDAAERGRVVRGMRIPAQAKADMVALIDEGGELIGIARKAGDELAPRVVLRDT